MKVFISADIEGVTGICSWDEADKNHPDYEPFRQQMMAEVLAACEGANAAGAREILINDAHDTGRNLDAGVLPTNVKLIRSWAPDPLCMIQGIDDSYSALMMIGYHSKAGSSGNPLAHTLSSRKVHRVKLNGEPASEFIIHALAAETFGVPTVLVTGDRALAKDVTARIPAAKTVATMRGEGNSVISNHPKVMRDQIRSASEEALRQRAHCHIALAKSYLVEIEYKKFQDAHRMSFYPGAERAGDHSVSFATQDYYEVMRFLQFL